MKKRGRKHGGKYPGEPKPVKIKKISLNGWKGASRPSIQKSLDNVFDSHRIDDDDENQSVE